MKRQESSVISYKNKTSRLMDSDSCNNNFICGTCNDVKDEDNSDIDADDDDADYYYNDIDNIYNIHTCLEKDINLYKAIVGNNFISDIPSAVIDDEIQLVLKIPIDHLPPFVASVWAIDRNIAINVEFNDLSLSEYLDGEKPKINCYQLIDTKLRKDAEVNKNGICVQLEKIAQKFINENWNSGALNNKIVENYLNKISAKTLNECNVRKLKELGFALTEPICKELLHLSKGDLNDTVAKLTAILDNANQYDDDPLCQELLNMGFQKDSTIVALELTQNTTEALDLLFRREDGGLFDPQYPVDSSVNMSQCFEAQKPNVIPFPSLRSGFLVAFKRYLLRRINTIPNYCVVCDEPHDFQMMKPMVCSRDLCVFAYQHLGVSFNIMEYIGSQPEIVSLLLNFSYIAATSERSEQVFEPFPSVVDPDRPDKLAIGENKFNRKADTGLVIKWLRDFPKLKDVCRKHESDNVDGVGCSCEHCVAIRPRPRATVLAMRLVQWIISSNLCHIVELKGNQKVSFLADNKSVSQYLLLSAPPDKETNFLKLKSQHGSVYAFHGSPLENWHSIIRRGLKNYSGTDMMRNGAAYGNGIYFSPSLQFAISYADRRYDRVNIPRSIPLNFYKSMKFCVALCEIIPDMLEKTSSAGWLTNLRDAKILVIPDAARVVTRFLFVFDSASVKEVNTMDTVVSAEIGRAFKFCD